MKHQTLKMGSILAVGIVAVVLCVGMVNGFSVAKPFISVGPMSDKNIGDQFTITGTTNLPVGSKILVEVYPASYESGFGTTTDPKTGAINGEFTGTTGTITVANGTGNVNAWSFPLDTNIFNSQEYTVTATQLISDASKGNITKGDTSGSAQFAIIPTPSSELVNGSFIHIDPIGDKNVGDQFTITGTTSLPVGSEILVEVYPASYESGFGTTTDPKTGAGSGEFNGVVGIVNVTAGTGNINIWSMDLDATGFSSGEYLVNASLFKSDEQMGDFTTGNPVGAAEFIVN
jgi:hypothetical protein